MWTLLRDLATEAPLAAGRPVETIFIGGGTPSLFSGEAIGALLAGIRSAIPVAPDVEITLEANPGAADAGRFADYRAAGVTRLSIGVQSLLTAQLKALGRVHDATEAIAAVEAAKTAGFDNINIDLMYGVPGDSVDGAVGDLQRALALEPAHISWYQLTLEPHTAFERRPPELPDDDTIVAIEEAGRALLASKGFERYEISAYGVATELFQARTEQTLVSIDEGLAAARDRGWMDPDPLRLRATPAGLQSLNRLLALI